jgi:hypothetical protein
MKRAEDATRAGLARFERQAAARAEAAAVAQGVGETVALSRARGAAIVEGSRARRRVCLQPYQKLSGLAWLARKGRLSAEQLRAGERYGAVYRRAKADQPIRSTLEIRPIGADATGPLLSETLAHAEGTAQAQAALAGMRRKLGRQADLVAACDLVCGEEQTPREAAGGDREAMRLEAVLKVALDLLGLRTGQAGEVA